MSRMTTTRTHRPLALMAVMALAAGACDKEPAPATTPAAVETEKDSPPVPLDANPPVAYPPEPYAQGISGTVVLRLYVTETGSVVPDSTAIEESSGYAELDSAALAAVPLLRYAPALRGGQPVAAPFRQPIHFRHPGGTETP